MNNGFVMTKGIIASTGKELTDSYIRIDAVIEPGVSGGALVNERAELIGILKGRGESDYYETLGYVIPIDNVVKDLQEHYR